MSAILLVGIIIFTGFLFGEAVKKIKLPLITGYVLAGVLLNPNLFNFMPKDIMDHTSLITNIALSFITFSIGGTLLYSKIKKLGKGIIFITLFEAEMAFFALIVGFLLLTPFCPGISGDNWISVFIPLALLLGCLGSPTDPTTTLAVTHEYNTHGKVTSTILGVGASDDALGLMNYSLAVVIAQVLITHSKFDVFSTILNPILIILGSFTFGTIFGFILNKICNLIKDEQDGMLIAVIFAVLSICYGVCTLVGADELLATMIMGIVVVNFNPRRDKIFRTLQKYAEDLIFIIFFTLCGMQLNFGVLKNSLLLILVFCVFRTLGKFLGTFVGATIAKSPPEIKKYTAFGLIPQGGIVIGLALTIKQNPAFNQISDIILSVIIGTTIIHELIGPITTKFALRKSGEIPKKQKNRDHA